MALIAGYAAARPRPTTEVRALVAAVGSTGSGDDYEQVIVPFAGGHLVAKYKPAHALPPCVFSDADGNTLVSLGVVFQPDPRSLLSLAVESSGQSLEQCEGEFVVLFADARTGCVHIVNDRFAARPFYVLERGGETYFASNPAFLLGFAGERYRPDITGWMEACTVGHTIGQRTTIAGVERLPPASHLTIRDRQITRRQYWRVVHQPNRELSAAAHSEAVFDAFRAGAVQRARLADRMVLALSGGLDSRLVAGALPRHADCTAFTFVDARGAESTPQTRAAAAVCAVLKLRHRVEALSSEVACGTEVIRLTGGMRPYQHMAVVMAYVQEVRRRGANFLLGGGPGDVLAGSYIPSPAYLDPARVDECMADAADRRLARGRDAGLIFRQEVVRSHRGAVGEEVRQSFAAVSGPTAAHRVTAWALMYRQPAFTFTTVFHTHPDVSEAVCHLDYRYTDLMLQLPAEWLYRKAFYSYMVYRCLPQLRHVPYANTGSVLSGAAPTLQVPPERELPRPLTAAYSWSRRTLGGAARRIYRQRRAPSLVFADPRLLADIEERMHSVPELQSILDLRRCDTLLAQTRAGACPSEEALGTLVSLCLSFSIAP